jgi:hypothetical protein
MTLSLARKSAKLWSAIALYRFGNHLGFPQIVEPASPADLSPVIVAKSKDDYQSGTGLLRSKGSADVSV